MSLFWDGKQVPVVAVNEGYFFVVPEAATPGRHVVVSQCSEYSPVSADFTVPTVPVPPTTPTTPTTSTSTDTRSTAPHSTTAPPTAGFPTARAPHSAVLTVVPNLLGSRVADAAGVLRGPGLVLGRVSGAGEVIRGQQPIPGAEIPRGSGVDVTTYSTGAPELVMVMVPNLVRRTVDEARLVLKSVGLVLGSPPAGSRTVSGQSPAAGTLTRPGSTVTVTVSGAPVLVSTPTRWWPLAGVLALLVVAALAVAVASRAVRTRREHRWVRTHLRADVDTAAGIGVDVRESPAEGSPPSCVVRIEPHVDSGTQVLEEVDR